MKSVKIGIALILLSGLLLIAGSTITISSPAGLLAMSLLVFLVLLSGQILLVWHYRPIFHQLRWVFFSIGLLILGMFIFSQQSWSAHGSPIVRILYLLNGAWLLSYTLIIGLVLGLHLYYCDYSATFIGVILICYVWANLIYLTRVGPDNFFQGTITFAGPLIFPVLICLSVWILPLGFLSFLWHAGKILQKELEPKQYDVLWSKKR